MTKRYEVAGSLPGHNASQAGNFQHVSLCDTPIANPMQRRGLHANHGRGTRHPVRGRLCTEVFLAVSQWEFHLPIFVGDTLRVVNEVVALEAKGRRRGQVRWFRKLINDEGKTVQSGYFDTLVARRIRKSSSNSGAESLKGPHLLSSKRESRSARADLEGT